jgi:alkylresorcinol/alkylpyrone synthase
MRIAAVGRALPRHYYDQPTLLAAFREHWDGRLRNPHRLEQLHRNLLVGGRHLALPLEAYKKLSGFAEANDAFIACATDLGERALRDALARAGALPSEVGHVIFVSVTGIATPSIDARIANRVGLPRGVRRTPIFGLGCVAGAVGLSRAADAVRAYPDELAALISVELCSLTLQRSDVSIPNLIASGLFGDGAACVLVSGARRPARGPRVLASRSVFFPETEHVMGWRITDEGFRVVLSGEVPDLAGRIRPDVDAFLAEHGLALRDVDHFVCHPGGPKVLRAFEAALALDSSALDITWSHLARCGNLSSASVLMVLGDTIETRRPSAGSRGLLLAMGPGFCAELVLLQW